MTTPAKPTVKQSVINSVRIAIPIVQFIISYNRKAATN